MQMQYPITIPKLVRTTRKLAGEFGFDLRPGGNIAGSTASGPSACLDEVGNLLRTLTSALPGGQIAEVGTGAGIGSAWLASGLNPGASLTTVELDPGLASAVRTGFSSVQGVEVLTGDWLEVLPSRGPFGLVFFDGGGPSAFSTANWPAIAALVKPHGIMVIDDLTPEEYWPDDWRGIPDPKRELAFQSGLFISTELRIRSRSAILLMVRD
jgi:predicted O-methyltransferase YrrM